MAKLEFVIAEVMKVLRAKKYAKMNKQQPELAEETQMASALNSSDCEAEKVADLDKEHQVSI